MSALLIGSENLPGHLLTKKYDLGFSSIGKAWSTFDDCSCDFDEFSEQYLLDKSSRLVGKVKDRKMVVCRGVFRNVIKGGFSNPFFLSKLWFTRIWLLNGPPPRLVLDPVYPKSYLRAAVMEPGLDMGPL
ncbi:hypothetical protein Salat_1839100 [Sesamum alatum]|uniref:Uncharacterized protein n=1 Tax=Sesamum alatum TaxID=300844 RepID=A0AAE1Y3I4_9LAMI|nr:hypothetical protein Salat_1839100 [Sesamum alatum]